MEAIKDSGVNLFGDSLPGLEEIRSLAQFVHSSERNLLAFAEQAESSKDNLAAGIAFSILSRDAEAIEKLDKASDCKEKFIFRSNSLTRMRKFDEAIDSLAQAEKNGADALLIKLEKAQTLTKAHRYDQAQEQLSSCKDVQPDNSEYNYVLGRLQEARGLYEESIESYKKAVEIQPENHRAIFHLAFACDLRGDEEAAIDYYQQLTSQPPVYVAAMLNLAVLYEDAGEYNKASQCVQQVLQFHPNHQRAFLFSKDIESSKTMLYDEEFEKSRSIRNKILETPISDFELSVRSRNCLRKMNIHTLGDLLNITETELLSYKNFGETSLTEIREILHTKGLELGMAVAESHNAELGDEEQDPEDSDLLNKPISEMDLTVRSHKCLERLDINTVGELVSKTEAELLGCKNFGMTSLTEIKEMLTANGLQLRQLD